MEYTKISKKMKSPVDGRVGIINVTVGNYVTPSSGALTTINSMNPIYVTFPLDSNDYAILSNSDGEANTNRKVELYMSNGEKYKLDGVQDFQDNKVAPPCETSCAFSMQPVIVEEKNGHGL